MYLQSWKKLTDKTYMLGNLDPKEKPRPFVEELLREAERNFAQQGFIEGIYLIDSNQDIGGTMVGLPSEIQLPQHVGRIKSVKINGVEATRRNSVEMELNSDHSDVASGPPTGWNTLGQNILQLNKKMQEDDSIAIFYESLMPSWHYVAKCYYVIRTITSDVGEAGIDLIADQELHDYYATKPIQIHSVEGIPTTYNSSTNNFQLDNTQSVDGVMSSISTLNNPAGHGSDGVDFNTMGIRGSWHKLTFDLGDTATKTATVVGSYLRLTHHNKNYGPTINKEHHDYLPYYVLSMILSSEEPNLAEMYKLKWDLYIDGIRDVYLDNDLKGQIETKTRSTWRNNG